MATALRPYVAAFRARFLLMLQYRVAALAGFATQCWWGAIKIMVYAAFYEAAVVAAPASTLVVYPAVDDITAASRSDGIDPHGWRTPGLQTGGDEFHSLRPYVIGDDLRRVHWPTTARRDELTVRQDERHQQGRTTVMLDVRRAVHDEASFERAVSATASPTGSVPTANC